MRGLTRRCSGPASPAADRHVVRCTTCVPEMIDLKELDRLQALVDHFEERKNRARQRLESVDGRWWCFALLGFAMEPEDYVVQDLLTIRRVVEPPGEVELASALKAPSYFSTIARYSQGIQY